MGPLRPDHSEMLYRPLGNTGLSVSILGFGASPLGNVFGDIDQAQADRAVHFAIGKGINFFDVSPYYGLTLAESRLGQALGAKRKDVILATKCGRYGAQEFNFSAPRIKAGFEESLQRLQTDYVDLLQAHDIEFGNRQQIIEETVPAMRELQRAGKARFVGITGYQLQMLTSVAEAVSVDTVLSYCRYNLLIDDMDSVLSGFAKQNQLGLINASPLHMGILTEQGAPSWHPAPEAVRSAGTQIAKLCRSRGVEPTQVALKYCFDHPYVSTTLVGMLSEQQVASNLAALDLSLDPELMAEIAKIAAPVKNMVWLSGLPENADYQTASA